MDTTNNKICEHGHYFKDGSIPYCCKFINNNNIVCLTTSMTICNNGSYCSNYHFNTMSSAYFYRVKILQNSINFINERLKTYPNEIKIIEDQIKYLHLDHKKFENIKDCNCGGFTVSNSGLLCEAQKVQMKNSDGTIFIDCNGMIYKYCQLYGYNCPYMHNCPSQHYKSENEYLYEKNINILNRKQIKLSKNYELFKKKIVDFQIEKDSLFNIALAFEKFESLNKNVLIKDLNLNSIKDILIDISVNNNNKDDFIKKLQNELNKKNNQFEELKKTLKDLTINN